MARQRIAIFKDNATGSISPCSMSKKGTYNVTASGDEAQVNIIGWIGDFDLMLFEQAVTALADEGVQNATIYLDSFGGDAFSAQRIGNAISRFKGEVSCHVGLIAASSASYILAKCAKRTIARNGQIMFHKPSITAGGNVDQVTANLKMLKSITRDFQKAYAVVLGKTEEEIAEMWKEDYWLDADEALETGFVHAILDDVVEPNVEVVAELTRMGKWTSKTTPNSTQTDMKNLSLITATLSLPEGSDEQAVLRATQALVVANGDLTKKVQSLEAQLEQNQQARVTALVNDAIKANKITEAERERYTKLATADFENTAAVLADKQPHVSASSRIANNGGSGAADKYQDWDFARFSKEAPEVLARIKTEDPDRYNDLRNSYLKSN